MDFSESFSLIPDEAFDAHQGFGLCYLRCEER